MGDVGENTQSSLIGAGDSILISGLHWSVCIKLLLRDDCEVLRESSDVILLGESSILFAAGLSRCSTVRVNIRHI